ncbi:MAG: hypothetical protein LBM96_05965 [Methanobrevibacter sp.]|jgi:hypothetical protein|nr:hypothetical protein [Candidatus Methanoflexus mossambicus]
MAVKIKQSAEKEFELKNYAGIATVKILALNPNAEELSKIFPNKDNSEKKENPIYFKTIEKDDKKIEQVRLDFYYQTVKEDNNDIEITSKITLFLNKEYRYNKDKTKIEVINNYGETTWIEPEALKSNEFPDNLSWFSKDGVRPAYIGEPQLINLLKCLFNIPNKQSVDDKSEAECYLEKTVNLFKGNYKEITSLLKEFPNNKFKVMIGSKITEKGTFLDTYNRNFIKYQIAKYDKFYKTIQDEQSSGAYKDTIFGWHKLAEINVENNIFSKENKSINALFEGNTSTQPTQTISFNDMDNDDLPF